MKKITKRRATQKAHRAAKKRMLSPSYIPVAHHVYYDGYCFRTRVIINGAKNSWSTSDRKKAIEYREFLLAMRDDA